MDYPASLYDRFDFGKHRGETVQEVIDTDSSYIDWCIEEVDGFELTDVAYDYLEDTDIGGGYYEARDNWADPDNSW